jgi:hypothetical protein
MAFATSNLNGGPYFNRFKLEGDWTGNSGDAVGTVQLAGGRVYEANFYTQATSPGGPTASQVPIGVSVVAPYITVQVYNHEEVTAGRFTIVYG